jgi:hypothetical protein
MARSRIDQSFGQLALAAGSESDRPVVQRRQAVRRWQLSCPVCPKVFLYNDSAAQWSLQGAVNKPCDPLRVGCGVVGPEGIARCGLGVGDELLAASSAAARQAQRRERDRNNRGCS